MRICLLGLIAACGGVSTQPDPDVDRQTVAELPVTANQSLDLLFVMDDSGAADVSANVARGLPGLFERLAAAIPTGLLDLHVGVITSDLGTSSSAGPPAPDIGVPGQSGCTGIGRGGDLTTGQAIVTENFLRDVRLPDGTRQRNYDGDLATVVGSMVRVGATGCGFEQPLAAMRAALDDNAANAGFLRSDSILAIVFVAEEDDCSARDPALFGPDTPDNPQQSFRCTRFGVTCSYRGDTPDEMNELGVKFGCGPNTGPSALLDDVAVFRDFVVGLEDDPRRVVIGGIFGDPQPFVIEERSINGRLQPALANVCRGADAGVAAPGVRLQAFADLFPERSVTRSICQNDLSTPLEDIAQLAAYALGTPCVGAALAEPLDCIVEDLRDGTATPLSPCPASPSCWQLVTDETSCTLFDHQKLEVVRDTPADPRTVTRARCATR